MRTWARWQTKTGRSNAYLYYFTREPPPDAPIKGPAHDAELYYVFHNLKLYDQQWGDWDRTLEEIMSSYWTNFAAKGDPNGVKVPRWPAFTGEESNSVMNFGDNVAVGASRLDKAKLDLLEAVYAKQMSR